MAKIPKEDWLTGRNLWSSSFLFRSPICEDLVAWVAGGIVVALGPAWCGVDLIFRPF